jgi:zinc protease
MFVSFSSLALATYFLRSYPRRKLDIADISLSPTPTFGASDTFTPAVINKPFNNTYTSSSDSQTPTTNSPPSTPSLTPESYVAEQVRLRSPTGHTITLMTLKNGHRLLVEERLGELAGMRTFIDTGSVAENAIKPSPLYQNSGFLPGLAHLDEHCHFLTTTHYPIKNSWAREVALSGATTNASTDNETIQHELFFNRNDLRKMLRLHTESLLNPTYNALDTLQEKKAVLNEVALRTKAPDFKMESALDDLLFDRPATQTGGRFKDVMAVTPEQLRRFYESSYCPEKMVTIVSGNVDPTEVLSVLGPAFSANTNRLVVPVNQALKPALTGQKSTILYDPEWSGSKLLLGFPGPALGDFKDRIAMEFLREALDGSVKSPLAEGLVIHSQLATNESMEYEPLKQTGLERFYLDCPPGGEKKALKKCLDILQQQSQKALSPTEITTIRERLISRFMQAQDTLAQSSFQLGAETSAGTLDYYLHYPDLAASIQAEDLIRVAKKYLNPQRYAVVFGLPESQRPPVIPTHLSLPLELTSNLPHLNAIQTKTAVV